MELYWWLVLAKLNNFTAVILGISIPCLILAVMGTIIFFEENIIFSKIKNYLCLIILLSSFLYILSPNKQDLALMYGWEALKSDTAKEVFETLKERLNEKY
jgi:hypothetical protein